MKWFRRHKDVDSRLRREAGQRHQDVKARAEKVCKQLEDRQRRNHLSEALADLMRGRP